MNVIVRRKHLPVAVDDNGVMVMHVFHTFSHLTGNKLFNRMRKLIIRKYIIGRL